MLTPATAFAERAFMLIMPRRSSAWEPKPTGLMSLQEMLVVYSHRGKAIRGHRREVAVCKAETDVLGETNADSL